ncbi:MAG: flagellar biosynthetic protein FliR [Alteromonadaceae bacterium]|nr:flagellar biosynthetic protein FliR [Alteromonadaceae bacterium]
MSVMANYAITAALVSARIGPMFVTVNSTPFGKLPGLIKIVFLMIACISIALVMPAPVSDLSVNELIKVFIQELLLGLALAFGLQIMFTAVLFAARVVDMQIGFGAAGIIDPATHNNSPLVGVAVGWIILMAFFSLDMHLEVVKMMTLSYQVVPLGDHLSHASIGMFIGYLTQQTMLAMLLFMPVIACLFLLDITLGVASKSMPQVNIYFVGLPVKIMIGIFVLASSVPVMTPVIEKITGLFSQFWLNLLAG